MAEEPEKKEFVIADLVKATGATPDASDFASQTASFTGVSIDSRTTQAGDCFFAIPGENFDGHDYVGDAFAKDAICAVVSRKFHNADFSENRLMRVDDTVKALGDLAREYRRQAGFRVVAITGSAGKTTTRHICHHVLSRRFKVHQSPKSFNNNIGLPLTLLGAGSDTEIVIAELGSNHPGEISYLTHVAEPDVAIVTNVHPAHLEGFGDLRTIVKEKSSIAEGLRPDGILIVNADFEQLVDACRVRDAAFVTFGKSDGANYRARDICLEGPASRFTIDGTEVRLPLAGPGNVENALAAWAVCSQFGMTVDEFAEAVATLPPVSMRTELVQIGTLTVLSDCYNANPASMKMRWRSWPGSIRRDGADWSSSAGTWPSWARRPSDCMPSLVILSPERRWSCWWPLVIWRRSQPGVPKQARRVIYAQNASTTSFQLAIIYLNS